MRYKSTVCSANLKILLVQFRLTVKSCFVYLMTSYLSSSKTVNVKVISPNFDMRYINSDKEIKETI